MAEEWFQGRVATEAEDRALERGVSWGDWGRTVGIGMADFDKMVMSGARALSELQGDTAAADRFVAASRLAEMDREDRTEGMSEIARRRLLAGVTSEEFLSAPVSSTVLKMFRMSPMLAASVIPAGLPGVSGLVGVAAMGGALSAADVIDGIYDEVDAASDKDLRLAAPFYDELRNMGMSEGDARQKYTSTIRGYKPVIPLVQRPMPPALPVRSAAFPAVARLHWLVPAAALSPAPPWRPAKRLCPAVSTRDRSITLHKRQLSRVGFRANLILDG
jgi:hypothetical protein